MQNGTTKITVEAFGKKHTIEFPEDSNVIEYIDSITKLLYGMGFCLSCIQDGYMAQVEQLMNECGESCEEDDDISSSDFEEK